MAALCKRDKYRREILIKRKMSNVKGQMSRFSIRFYALLFFQYVLDQSRLGIQEFITKSIN